MSILEEARNKLITLEKNKADIISKLNVEKLSLNKRFDTVEKTFNELINKLK
jgi:hypothetical protein